MIMFPTQLSSSSKYINNGGFSEGGYDCFISLGKGFSDLMAEDESRTETSINNNEEAGSTEMNTHEDYDHGTWLQLSLGGGRMQSTTTGITTSHGPHVPLARPLVDLDLLPGGGGGSSSRQIQRQLPPPPQLVFQVPEFRGHFPTSNTFFLHPQQGAGSINSVPTMTLQQQQQQQQEINYNYLQLIRPFPSNMMTQVLNPPVSSSSSLSGSSEQHGRHQHHIHRRLNIARVVNPPRRPHSGVWFMLQASQNQAKEPFLPQIPKSYLRIKDGKMTVGLLIKYLVNKLELGSESEIEITCKGHQLLSLSTLQHVRDTIWNNPRNDVGLTLVPQSSATINHLMVLNYGRIA
uniref:uncharacterized protein LOC122585832 n=1 Tax=Erigeron canadensis TaxID=72917 RepID=UPI001CB924B5|nr:uncharacterized protein LOC122585832 [Erigeron canadensis]